MQETNPYLHRWGYAVPVSLFLSLIIFSSCSESSKKETITTNSSSEKDTFEYSYDKFPQQIISEQNFDFPSSSNGTGGESQDVTESFTSSEGTKGEYTFSPFVGANPAGLMIYLHGSGNASAYKNNLAKYKSVATANNMGLLLVKTALTDSWLKGGEPNIAYLDEIIQNEVLGQYNISYDNMAFVGTSGGAVFLTGFFIPRMGYKYKAKIINLCGGSQSLLSLNSLVFHKSPAMTSQLEIAFRLTSGDYMIDQVNNAAGYYKNLGFTTSIDTSGDGDHCAFDDVSYLESVL